MNLVARKIEKFTLFISWAACVLYVTSPDVPSPVLPGDLRIADIIVLVVVFSAFFILINRKGLIPVPAFKTPVLFFLVYIIVILALPLFGIMFYNAHLHWYYGDLRWLLILLVGFALILVYRSREPALFVTHFTWFLLVLTAIQLVVLASQVAVSLFGTAPNVILELWYPAGEGGYGNYGHHINRYAAGLTYASGLARFGAITLVYSAVNLYLHFEKRKSPDYRLFFLLFSGILFVIASGTRTMMFAMPVAILFIFAVSIVVRGRISYKSLSAVLYGGAGIVAITVLAFRYNVGRISSGDRLMSVIDLIMGRATLDEIAGRGGFRWTQPLNEAFTEWGWHGTLVNASHAMDHLPAIDSYIVFSIAQGGPFIIMPFFLLCMALIVSGFWLIIRGDSTGALVLGVAFPILAASLSQNTMTELSSRVFLTLAICGLYVWKTPKPLNKPVG